MKSSHFLRVTTIVLSSILSFLTVACTTTKEVKKPSQFDYCGGKVILAKSLTLDPLENISKPENQTNTFFTEDKEAIAYLKCNNLTGDIKLRWEWYSPDGKLYSSTEDKAFVSSPEKYVKMASVWHRLAIRGEKAADYPGEWKVRVFLDKDKKPFASNVFKLEGDLIDIVRRAEPVSTDKNKWALIIGIEKYRKTTEALFAERDAILIKEYFNRFYGIPKDHITTLVNENATGNEIKDYVENKLHFLTPKDTLYFYYSGHGGTVSAEKPDEGVPYLLPYDGNPYNLKGTGYALETLYTNLENLKAKNIYVFMDACFSGSTGRSSEEKPLTSEKAISLTIKPEGIEGIHILSKKMVSFTSSQWNQLSNSNPKERYGLFTTYLVKGIVDKQSPLIVNGKVTVEELNEYIKEKVSEDALKFYGLNRKQEPGTLPSQLDRRKDWIIWSK